MNKDIKLKNFLKECISDGLLSLMRTKKFDKISVEEICAKSGVSRATFYRNFKKKEQAVSFKLIILWERYTELHNLKVRNDYDVNNALDFFTFNLEIKDILNIIYACGLQSALYSAFYEIMMPKSRENTTKRYCNRFYSYGLFGLLDEWIQNGYNETPAQMAEFMLKHLK